MLITLVHPFPDPAVHGLRVLRALLRQDGHRVQFVHLPDRSAEGTTGGNGAPSPPYPRRTLEQLCAIAAESDLIGLSLMTNYHRAAVQISGALRRQCPGALQVWGGVHPTIRPEECLDHADVVVIGEGETSLAELARRVGAHEAWDDVPGIAFRRDGELVRTPLPPLETDLDRYPLPDIDLEDQWVWWDGQLVPVTATLTRRMMASTTVSAHYGKVGYQTMTSRGCPHRCSYCVNSTLRDLYAGQRYVRFRSVESVIEECERVLRRFPFVDYLWFSDDVFVARPLRDLEHFSERYAQRIGLPFYLLVSPASVTEDKYRVLVEAGLHTVQMGIETGSAKIQDVFHRQRMGNERALRAASILAAHAHRTEVPQYDFITDIPWEDDADRRDTLRLVAQLPRPYRLQLFSLVLYPATAAHQRACEEGRLADEQAQVYQHMYTHREEDYLNLLLSLASRGVLPGWLIEAAADERLDVLRAHAVMRPLGRVGRRLIRAAKRVRDLRRRVP